MRTSVVPDCPPSPFLCLQDLLNHLDSCDLDDDDLMLDADNSDHSSLFSGTEPTTFFCHSAFRLLWLWRVAGVCCGRMTVRL